MKTFAVFQQLFPKPIGKNEDGTTLYEPRLERVGIVHAVDEAEAIVVAKQLPEFRRGKELGKFPIVEDSYAR